MEVNMSQIVTNQSLSRHEASRPTRNWSRFVHALDDRLESMVDTLLVWQRRHRDRMQLMALDGRLLRDIGIGPADVDREASKPFWRS